MVTTLFFLTVINMEVLTTLHTLWKERSVTVESHFTATLRTLQFQFFTPLYHGIQILHFQYLESQHEVFLPGTEVSLPQDLSQ